MEREETVFDNTTPLPQQDNSASLRGFYVTDENGNEVWISDVTIQEIVRRAAKIERRLDRKDFKGVVYLSYTDASDGRREDALKIVKTLFELNYVLIDYHNSPDSMADIEDVDSFVVFYDAAYATMQRCYLEIRHAVDHHRRIIVVNLEGKLPNGWLGATFNDDNSVDFPPGREFNYVIDEILDFIQFAPGDRLTPGSKISAEGGPEYYRKRRDYEKLGFQPVEVPTFLRYFSRRNDELRILNQVKNVCNNPEAGVLAVYGETGTGKTTLVAQLFGNSNKAYHNSLARECDIHVALWINCYQWRDPDVQTFKDAASQKSFLARVLKVAQKGDPLVPNYATLSGILAHFQGQNRRPLMILDDLSNPKLLLFVRNQCKAFPCCIVTRDPAIFAPIPEAIKVKEFVKPLSDEELVEMFEKTYSIKATKQKLTKLAIKCMGSPLVASLVAARFGERNDHDNLSQQLTDTIGKDIFITSTDSPQERLSRVVRQLFEASFAQMDISQVISFNAFLFYDPGEPICSDEVAFLWGFEGNDFKTGGILKSRALCHLFEKRGFIVGVEKESSDQDDRYLMHSVVHETAFQIARRTIKASDLAMFRLRLVTGSARLNSGSMLVGARPTLAVKPDIEILCESIIQQKGQFLEKIFEKINADDLAVICGQKSTKTNGKVFLHHLYRANWADDVLFDGDLARCGVNRSYRMIDRVMYKLATNKISFIEIFKEKDSDQSCLLFDLFEDEQLLDHQNDRLRIISRLSRWMADYWLARKVEDPPLVQSVLRGHVDNVMLANASDALRLAAKIGRADIVQALVAKCSDAIEVRSSVDNLTPLAVAASYGHIDVVKAFFKAKAAATACLRITDPVGVTPLMQAARNGHVDVVEYLLQQDPDGIELHDFGGWTAMIHAAVNGHTSVAMALYRANNSCVNTAIFFNHRPPILCAAMCGQLEVCQFLYEKSPETMKTPDDGGFTALMLAATTGQVNIVQFLYSKDPEAINGVDNTGRTALMHAAKNGHIDTVEFLFDHEESSVKKLDLDNWTALMFAAYRGSFECVQFLYTVYPDAAEIVNEDGEVALMVAASKGHLEIVQHLYTRFDTAIWMVDKKGMTAIALASVNGHLDVIDYLHEHWKDGVQLADNEGRLPLTLATMSGRLPVVKSLFKKWPDAVKMKDNRGWTPVLHAVSRRFLSIIMYFYEEFADSIKLRDTDGVTPLMLASSLGFMEIIRYLTENYPDAIRLQNTDGMSALMMAAAKGHLEICQYLFEKLPESGKFKDNEGRTATAHAAATGHVGVVQFFCERFHLGLRLQDNDGWSPLMISAANGHLSVVQFLCDHLVDATTEVNNDNRNAMMVAAMAGQLDVVKYLFDRDPLSAFAEDINHLTAQKLAAEHNQKNVADYLLSVM